jgi:hypothetical protein
MRLINVNDRLKARINERMRLKGKTIPNDLDKAIMPKVISRRILGLDHSIGEHHQQIAWP